MAKSRHIWATYLLSALLAFGATGGAFAEPNSPDEGDRLYHKGHYEKAIAWWKDAAMKGNPNAQYRLGVAYSDGVARDKEVIIARDFDEAAKWYTMSAELGDERAQFDLGALYDNGAGVKRDYEQAAKWYLASAERGHMASQYNVAVMYETGTGVPQDLVAAYKWYYLAAEQDFVEFGCPALEALAGKLKPEEVRKAITMAKDFELKTGAY